MCSAGADTSPRRSSTPSTSRREPIEVRKGTLASILRKSLHGVRLNEHLDHDCALTVFQHAWGHPRLPGRDHDPTSCQTPRACTTPRSHVAQTTGGACCTVSAFPQSIVLRCR